MALSDEKNERPRMPLQFGVRTLLAAAAGIALLLGLLRWFEVPPAAIGLVLGMLVVAMLGAVALVVAIGRDG